MPLREQAFKPIPNGRVEHRVEGTCRGRAGTYYLKITISSAGTAANGGDLLWRDDLLRAARARSSARRESPPWQPGKLIPFPVVALNDR
jgi:hypothetical protein